MSHFRASMTSAPDRRILTRCFQPISRQVGKCRARSSHRLIDQGRVGLREFAENDVAIDRASSDDHFAFCSGRGRR